MDLLGSGGMGEVYRARDTRLGRVVALKLLLEGLTSDPDRKARFEREARAASALNHPHICVLHDIGHQDGTDFIVMEHLQGEILSERLKRGPLPVDLVLRYGTEIADALVAAHRAGIVHRDIKPGNIMLTKDGTKLLDFGLAKPRARGTGHSGGSQLDTATEKPLTGEGSVVGTVQYMSPEQLEGRPTDHRTDIWSLGCVLYEMSTGARAFDGKSQASLIASILKDEPRPMRELRAILPAALDRLVRACLLKELAERMQDARDVARELRWVTDDATQPRTEAAVVANKRARAAAVAGACLLLGSSAGIVAWLLPRPVSTPSSQQVSRFLISAPPASALAVTSRPALAFAADGMRIVFAVQKGGATQLAARSLDQVLAVPIPGTDGASGPFLSPDGRWIGFVAHGTLRKVPIEGGEPTVLGSAPRGRGAGWGFDDAIFFTPGPGMGLWRVAGDGSGSRPFTVLSKEQGERTHRWPSFIPEKRIVLFTARAAKDASFDEARILAVSPAGTKSILVKGGTQAVYLSSGHLVFARGGSLCAVPFDIEGLVGRGNPTVVVEGVLTDPSTGATHFALSQAGSLAYIPGGLWLPRRSLLLADRKGSARPLSETQSAYETPRLSPDGRRVAVGVEGASDHIAIVDRGTGDVFKLTFENGSHYAPVWSPDGARVAFASNQSGAFNIFWKASDGSGTAEQLTIRDNSQVPTSWSPDGRHLAYTEYDANGGADLWILAIEPERKARPLLQTSFNERGAAFSPNGRWIAYESDESGRNEVYVQAFPGPGGKRQLSTDGGSEPVWTKNGRELVYRVGDRLLSVPVAIETEFGGGRPRPVFDARDLPVRDYQGLPVFDVSADGQAFVMIRESTAPPTQFHVVLNWVEELKRKVPTSKGAR